MEERGLAADDIAHVRTRVHAAAIDVLGSVADLRTVHQSKFSMGFVLAQIAKNGSAGIGDFTEEALEDAGLRDFSEKVEMVLDPEVDAAYPRRWIGVVEIETADGGRCASRVEVPKGDPDNTLSRAELEDKAGRLAAFGGGGPGEERARVGRRPGGVGAGRVRGGQAAGVGGLGGRGLRRGDGSDRDAYLGSRGGGERAGPVAGGSGVSRPERHEELRVSVR